MVAFPTVSTGPDRVDTIDEYLREVLEPALAGLGCVVERFDNPVAGHGPLLVGRRHEADDRPTVLVYGHADVVDGLAGQWSHDRDPWRLAQAGAGSQERWYGRGAADNKAQHLVNLSALGILLAEQGRLGFNLTVLIETSEEVGSPGLAEFAQEHRDLLAADVLIASDGPRLAVDVPTLFLGARGGVNLDLDVDLRLGSYHSGNWGGILRNPATTLAGAIDSLVDGHGRVRVEALRPPPPSESVRAALGRLDLHSEPDDPEPDPTWGETELSPAERLYAWNTLEVLAIGSGDVDRPVNAIPGRARACLQLRFVVGTDISNVATRVQEHLDGLGFSMVRVRETMSFAASRTDPDHPWVSWAAQVLAANTDGELAVLPNIGGSLPNYVFTDVLGLPTIWLPHSHPGCRQHAPDEHMLKVVARDGMVLATALFHALGNAPTPRSTPDPARGPRRRTRP